MAISFLEQRTLLKTGDFKELVIQAILTAAIAIRNEPVSTENHISRVSLASAVIMNPSGMEPRFSELLSTLMTNTNPSDAEISNAVSSVWDAIALTMYPAA